MYEFWHDYIKPKYQNNAKLCYVDTYSFIIHIKTEDVYEDIAEDVEKRFNISNYEVNKPLLREKNKKKIELRKDDLVGNVMTECTALTPKTYSDLMDNGDSDKKVREQKNV